MGEWVLGVSSEVRLMCQRHLLQSSNGKKKKTKKQDTKEVSDTLRVLEHGTLDGKVIYEMKCLYFHEMKKFIFFLHLIEINLW